MLKNPQTYSKTKNKIIIYIKTVRHTFYVE